MRLPALATLIFPRTLRKGTYSLSAGGRDAQGRNVVATARVMVKR